MMCKTLGEQGPTGRFRSGPQHVCDVGTCLNMQGEDGGKYNVTDGWMEKER